MKLSTRGTHAFIEIKADELETTLFKMDQQDIASMIQNLLEVATDLTRYLNDK